MKPKHLSKEYGDQFQDEGVVARYHHRPAYPSSLFKTIAQHLPETAKVLDLGCGTGELSIPLSEMGFKVDAVDPSAAMIKRARQGSSNVKWFNCYTEEFSFDLTYELIIAANSLHWMDWSIVFPKFKQALSENGKLAIITGGDLVGYEGSEQVLVLVKRYSTNQDFEPFSLTELLLEGGYIGAVESFVIEPIEFSQSVDAFIESIHARNGFSVERMGEKTAQEFDLKLRDCLSVYGDKVTGKIKAELSFTKPA